ncbi:unnamed protein product [Paramecium primaurelia]|uniref:Coronin n=1 Tax=Paramecium primaurelia TaxID=5886 RepID=A0A8S1JXY4_PARPR|nr:unnamed protein product [Paramecium primaurelia]
MKALRFKHLYGEEMKSKFEQVTPTTITCDSTMVKANGLYTALLWQTGGGGLVCVLRSDKPTKLPFDTPMIKGHQGTILDLDWYPFDDEYLATSSQDQNICVWKINDLTTDITEPLTTLSGHDKKVNLIQWNPTSAWVLGSASHDQTVKVWDVQAGAARNTINANALPYSIDWNLNGSLIGSSWNDKKLKIIDPRQQTLTLEVNAHQGTKPQRFAWLGSTGYFVSVGFNKTQGREFSLWNASNPSEPVSTTQIDTGSGVLYPYWDEQLKVLYLSGKGDSSIKYFEFLDGQLHFLNQYTSNKPGKSYAFFPKRAVDVNICEVNRVAKIEENALSYVQLIAPRKSNTFQEDLFPPCPGTQPAQTAAQFFGGQNANPVLISLKPDQQQQQQQQQQNVVFTQQPPKPQQQQQLTQPNAQDTQKIAQLESTVQHQQQQIMDLQAQVQNLQIQNQELLVQLSKYEQQQY